MAVSPHPAAEDIRLEVARIAEEIGRILSGVSGTNLWPWQIELRAALRSMSRMADALKGDDLTLGDLTLRECLRLLRRLLSCLLWLTFVFALFTIVPTMPEAWQKSLTMQAVGFLIGVLYLSFGLTPILQSVGIWATASASFWCRAKLSTRLLISFVLVAVAWSAVFFPKATILAVVVVGDIGANVAHEFTEIANARRSRLGAIG